MSIETLSRNMLVAGAYRKVTMAVRFNPEAAIDILAPLALSHPDRVATECDGAVQVVILSIDDVDV